MGPLESKSNRARFARVEDLPSLVGRIRLLLDRPPEARAGDVERTLTDGYAHALALEAERRRAETRLRALAGSADHLVEALALKGRVGRIEEELGELRLLLRGLAAKL